MNMSELLLPDTQKAINKRDSNLAWYRNNYQSLKRKYKGQIILIVDEDVIETYRNVEELQQRLEKKILIHDL